jgi:hypothetical protein
VWGIPSQRSSRTLDRLEQALGLHDAHHLICSGHGEMLNGTSGTKLDLR